MISIVAGLPRPDPRAVARLADAISGRAGDEAYRAFHRELYDWIVRYARDVEPGSLRVEEIGELWDRIRDAERETEELNLDRKLHILALFAEIAATAPRALGTIIVTERPPPLVGAGRGGGSPAPGRVSNARSIVA